MAAPADLAGDGIVPHHALLAVPLPSATSQPVTEAPLPSTALLPSAAPPPVTATNPPPRRPANPPIHAELLPPTQTSGNHQTDTAGDKTISRNHRYTCTSIPQSDRPFNISAGHNQRSKGHADSLPSTTRSAAPTTVPCLQFQTNSRNHHRPTGLFPCNARPIRTSRLRAPPPTAATISHRSQRQQVAEAKEESNKRWILINRDTSPATSVLTATSLATPALTASPALTATSPATSMLTATPVLTATSPASSALTAM
uniref:Uncharacterized protein n=1 Tax=Populus alba TaxID=43335 RepID=A0A4V6XW26_POPAL|nr:hypothetical protein D5086_0000283190 [Populus alba]